MIIKYEILYNTFKEILISRKLSEDRANILAKIFADNTLDGVLSHGVNRFPRFISYIDKGEIDIDIVPETTFTFNGMVRMDGKRGIGPINAYIAMQKACELAKIYGISMVALGNTNHWMRGGTYGYLACENNLIGICFSNTTANMVAYNASEPKLGNNPLVIGIPRENKAHVVLDFAISQYSYGKVAQTNLEGKKLDVPGGYDTKGNITNDPEEIIKSGCLLPIGYWKGSGLSLVLDLMATVLTAGNSVAKIKSFGDEVGLSQIFIAIDPNKANTKDMTNKLIDDVLSDFSSAKPFAGKRVSYPGENTIKRREANKSSGVEIVDSVWDEIMALKKAI